jgi:hypothetical protein
MASEPISGVVCFPKYLFSEDIWLAEGFDIGRALIDLWHLANDRRRQIKIRGVDVFVERGQTAYSIGALAERWHCSNDKARRILSELQDARKITITSSNLTTIITVPDYKLFNPDTTPKFTPNSISDHTPEPAAKPLSETISDHTPEPIQKIGSKEDRKGEEKKIGRGEESPPVGSLVPSNEEVSAFCSEWPGDLSRGIPAGIPAAWWTGWLADRLNSDRAFPSNWKRVLILKFVSDWVNGHPKAVGSLFLEKKSATTPANGHPSGWRREGDQEWWWTSPLLTLEAALNGAVLQGDEKTAGRLREIIHFRKS